jgi:parallel beta-helix repeat protein
MSTITINPGANIQNVINSAASGDTIVFTPGTYSISNVIELKSGVSLEGQSGATLASNGSAGIFEGLGVHDISISGFVLDGQNSANQDGGAIVLAADGGTPSNNIHILNNTFQNFTHSSDLAFWSTQNTYVQGNTLTDGYQGISWHTSADSSALDNLVISNNTITNMSRMGIETGFSSTVSNVHIDYNNISHTGDMAMSVVEGDVTGNFQSGTIIGNTIDGPGYPLLEIGNRNGPFNMTVADNTLSNSEWGMSIGSVQGAAILHNTFNNVQAPYSTDGGYDGTEWIGANTIDGKSVTGWSDHGSYGTEPTLYSPLPGETTSTGTDSGSSTSSGTTTDPGTTTGSGSSADPGSSTGSTTTDPSSPTTGTTDTSTWHDYVGGTSGGDTLSGTAGNDNLVGLAGNDNLSGGKGNDMLWGGSGNDQLNGGNGNDLLVGGFGADQMNGGAGKDILLSRSDAGEPTAQDGTHVFGSETAAFTSSNDTLTGGQGADTFRFEGLINAKDDIVAKHVNSDGTIDWAGVAGENGAVHDHWVDGFGKDVITDFSRSQGDTIQIAANGAAVQSIKYSDSNGDGVKDTSLITVVEKTGGAADNGDLLGTITVHGDLVKASDVHVDSTPVYGAYDRVDSLPEGTHYTLEDHGVLPNGQHMT